MRATAQAVRTALSRAARGSTKVMRAIDPRPTDVFLEIGPGRGALTRPLWPPRPRASSAFEIDRDLAAGAARDRRRRTSRVVEGDFLDVTAGRRSRAAALGGLADDPLRVAGNLPYNVASPILFKLVELHRRGRAARRRDGDAAARGGRPPARRRRARSDYGVLSVLIGTVARRRTAAHAAAGRVPAARRRCGRRWSGCGFTPPDPPARDDRRRSRRSSRPSSRGGGRRSRTRCWRIRRRHGCTPARRWREPASTARRRPETLDDRGARAARRRAVAR